MHIVLIIDGIVFLVCLLRCALHEIVVFVSLAGARLNLGQLFIAAAMVQLLSRGAVLRAHIRIVQNL